MWEGRAREEWVAARCAALHLDEEPETGDEVIRLEDLIELNPKVPAPTDSVPVYVDMQKLPVTGMSILQWTHRPAKGGARFQNGDTLLARITPCLENRKTGYVDFLDEDQVAIGSTESIVMRSRLGVPSGLSFFLAISDRFRSFGIRHMLGTSGRQRLSAGDLRGFRLRATDDEALKAFQLLSTLEGIIPALEPAHAIAKVAGLAPKKPKDHLMVVNLSGRGDKDIYQVAEHLGAKF